MLLLHDQASPNPNFADIGLPPLQRDNTNTPIRASSPRQSSPTSDYPQPPMPTNTSPTMEKTAEAAMLPRQVPLFPRNAGRTSPHSNTTATFRTEMEGEGIEEMGPDSTGTDFVFVESPHSKARALRALRKEQLAREQAAMPAPQPQSVNRNMTLPTPPVYPVLPSFDDILASRKVTPPSGDVDEALGGGVRRKPSVVKKIRDRMVK